MSATSGSPANSASKPAQKAVVKSARRRARELALQGLYQWLLSRTSAAAIEAHMASAPGFERSDKVHFSAVLGGVIRQFDSLQEHLLPSLDRELSALSPVEHAALLIGTFELLNHQEVPYKVVINEAVELSKSFGGADGFKYVNGVLDKVAARLRSQEIQR